MIHHAYNSFFFRERMRCGSSTSIVSSANGSCSIIGIIGNWIYTRGTFFLSETINHTFLLKSKERRDTICELYQWSSTYAASANHLETVSLYHGRTLPSVLRFNWKFVFFTLLFIFFIIKNDKNVASFLVHKKHGWRRDVCCNALSDKLKHVFLLRELRERGGNL